MDPITIAMSLAQFAPAIVKWLTNSDKAADAAASVVNIAQTVTGSATPAEALQMIQSNAQAQLDFKNAVLSREAELDKAYLADVQSARSRDIEVRKISGGENDRATWMIIGDLLGLLMCIVALLFFSKDMPPAVSSLLNLIAAGLVLCLRDAHQFEFGSSRGSKEKDAALTEIAKMP